MDNTGRVDLVLTVEPSMTTTRKGMLVEMLSSFKLSTFPLREVLGTGSAAQSRAMSSVSPWQLGPPRPFFWRQRFIMLPWLTTNSLCRAGWPWIHKRPTCLCPRTAEMNVYHPTACMLRSQPVSWPSHNKGGRNEREMPMSQTDP